MRALLKSPIPTEIFQNAKCEDVKEKAAAWKIKSEMGIFIDKRLPIEKIHAISFGHECPVFTMAAPYLINC